MGTNNGTLLPTNSPPTFSSQNGGILVFDGTEDYISTQTPYTYSTSGATPFSLGVWFKTSDSRGRKLIGFESSQTGASASYDRHLYLGTDGKLYFGVYNYTEFAKLIISTDTYGDNYWYYASVTFSGTDMKLYVNGVLVASSAVAGAEPKDGYWRIGGGTLGGWTNSSSGTFSGSIGPVHLYAKALTATEVLTNFTAARPRFISTSTPTVAASANGTAINVTVSGGTGVASYAIQRATSTSGPWTTLTTNATSPNYSDVTPVASVPNYYRAKFIQTDNKNTEWSSASNGVTPSATSSTQGLSFKTNFGPGTYMYNTSNWGTGAFYYIGGLDQSTGYDFTEMSVVNGGRVQPNVPVLYGNGLTNAFQLILPAGSAYTIPSGGPGIRDLSNEYFDFRFENIAGPPGSGITTACYIARKLPYSSPAQLGYNMFPGATQDMFYIRYWRKYKTGFFASKVEGGTSWQTITSSKTDDYIINGSSKGANRPFYAYQNNDRTGSVISDSSAWGSTVNRIYRRSATIPAAPVSGTVNIPSGWYDKISQVPAGTDPMWMSQGSRELASSNDPWTWSTPAAAAAEDSVSDTFRGEIFNQWTNHPVDGVKLSQAMPAINENEWILYEFAFKPSNSDSIGWQWAAVNGVQAFAVRGKNIPDNRIDKINRLGPFGYYIDGTQSADSRLGFWTTGLEVWEKWPSYASSHPDWGSNSLVSTPPTITVTPVTATSIQIQITASPAQGQTISSYRIERSPNGIDTWTTAADISTASTTASYTNPGLTASTTYYYRARFTLTDGTVSGWSVVRSATTLAVAVPLPPAVTATATSTSSITVQVTATPNQGQTVSSYQIERSLDNLAWTSVTNSASTSNTFTFVNNTGLVANTRYYYRARFTQADASVSAWSTSASATTLAVVVPAGPTVTATATSSSSITIQITATPNQGQTVTSYQIERSLTNTSSGWTALTTLNSTSNTASYVNSTLTQSTTYYYRVRFTQADGGISNWSSTASATTQPAAAVTPRLVVLRSDLARPWGMTFLPDGRALVTQRDLKNILVLRTDWTTQATIDVSSLNILAGGGQGGLMDIALDPDFATTPWVYFTYSKYIAQYNYVAAVARGLFNFQTNQLGNIADIYVQTIRNLGADAHFGCRMAFHPTKKTLFVSFGERQTRTATVESVSQDLNYEQGKIIRINRDGSKVTDINDEPAPFPNNLKGEIWSRGHRNPQGLAFRPGTTQLWSTEQGEDGGDEVNFIERGANYGWSTVAYGWEYPYRFTDPYWCTTAGWCAARDAGIRPERTRIGGGVHAPTFKEPAYYWPENGVTDSGQSAAPSGLMFYTGQAFPQWNGNMFVPCLAGPYGTTLYRLSLTGDTVNRNPQSMKTVSGLSELNARLRCAVQGPDGFIYVLTDSATTAKLLQIRPV